MLENFSMGKGKGGKRNDNERKVKNDALYAEEVVVEDRGGKRRANALRSKQLIQVRRGSPPKTMMLLPPRDADTPTPCDAKSV